jgi:hypothetical protein
MLLVALSMPSSAIRYIRKAAPTPELLAALLPKQVGGFGLARTWYEQQEGTIVLENGTYSTRGSDEITLGVWIAPRLYVHDTEQCWLARGLKPVSLVKSELVTAGGQSSTRDTTRMGSPTALWSAAFARLPPARDFSRLNRERGSDSSFLCRKETSYPHSEHIPFPSCFASTGSTQIRPKHSSTASFQMKLGVSWPVST